MPSHLMLHHQRISNTLPRNDTSVCRSSLWLPALRCMALNQHVTGQAASRTGHAQFGGQGEQGGVPP